MSDDRNQPTIYDVAKEAGVSPATVSRVMNHYPLVSRETSEKVIAAMKKLGFVRNESKSLPQMAQPSLHAQADKQHPHIFVLSIPHMASPFAHSLIEGAQTAAVKAGHQLLVNTTPVNEHNSDFFITTLKNHGIAGILVTEPISEAALLKVNKYFPMVQCGEYNPSVEELSYVSVDDLQTSGLAANLLLESGAKQILFLTSPENKPALVRRSQGFQQALAASRTIYDPDLIFRFPTSDVASMARKLDEIFAGTKPDAVLASNDVLAAAACHAAIKNGLQVPHELQVLSLEDGPLAAHYTPAISALKSPCYAVGFHAFEQLLEEFLHPLCHKKHLLLESEYIHRETTI